MANNSEAEIKNFFEGRPGSLRLFSTLRKMIMKIGIPKIEVQKTQISFGEKYKYAWVWLPQTWIKKRSEHSITLTILTDKKIASTRITESVQPKKGFWTHHILIESEKDIDKDVENLLRKSYEFYLTRLEGKRERKSLPYKK